MPRHRAILSIPLFLLLCAAAPLSSAQPDNRGGRRPPQPPPEALQACEGQQENAVCSFSGRGNDLVKGICITPPGLDTRACAPEGGPPDGPPRSGRRD